MKVKVISSFSMGGILHHQGDEIEVTKEQAERFSIGGYVRMIESPKSKMIKSAPKKKSAKKKKK